MAAGPVAGRHGVGFERHPNTVARVEACAAYLGELPARAHVARAPLGVGLEAAGRQDHVFRRHRAGAPTVPHADALYAIIVGDERDRPGVIVQRDAVLLRRRRKRGDEPRSAAMALDGEATPELEFAVHLKGLPAPDR